MSASLTPAREQEIRARVERLDTDRVFLGSEWTASTISEESTLPPENTWVVEDVVKTGTATIRGSVGAFGDEVHAQFTAHAPQDMRALLAEVDRLRDEVDVLRGQLLEATGGTSAVVERMRQQQERIAELEARYLPKMCECGHSTHFHTTPAPHSCFAGNLRLIEPCDCGEYRQLPFAEAERRLDERHAVLTEARGAARAGEPGE